MELLSHNKSSEARFVERKYIALLDQPVESSGELSYVAPDRLEKRTLKPKPESMVLEGGMLTLERGGRKRSLPLADYPEVGAFVESIRGTLAGDREALQRAYGLALEGDAAQWTLTLTPSEPRMAQIVQKIRIGGSRGEVKLDRDSPGRRRPLADAHPEDGTAGQGSGLVTAARRIAIAIWLAAMAGCVLIVARTQFTADLSAFLPKTPTREQQVLVDQLRDGAVSRLILIGIDQAAMPHRARASRVRWPRDCGRIRNSP